MDKKLKTYKTFKELQNHKGVKFRDLAFCEETKIGYFWNSNAWIPLKEDANSTLKSNLNLGLYDLNKNIISQLKPLTEKEIKEKLILIENFHKEKDNNNYMLLCKDYNYYTIFQKRENEKFQLSDVVYEIINDLGKVKSIEKTLDGLGIEIWIELPQKNEPYVFYFFAYDRGVVNFG